MGFIVSGDQKRALKYGLIFTSPWIIGFMAFMLLPMVLSFYYSFCDYSVLNPPAFVGMQNYEELWFDEVFWLSLYNTIYFAVFALPLGTVLALALALLLNANVRGLGIFRTIFFIPALVPLVALAILWQDILNTEYGIVNQILSLFNVPSIDWLGDPSLAKPGLVLTTMWVVGHPVVLYLAGLQEIPRTLYEAARVDGANYGQQMVHITLPMVSPVIYFNLIMGCIGVLQIFALPYVMTEGGPARSTTFYTMYLFDQAFSYLNMGYACAMAWILFGLIALLTYSAHKISSRFVVYGGG